MLLAFKSHISAVTGKYCSGEGGHGVTSPPCHEVASALQVLISCSTCVVLVLPGIFAPCDFGAFFCIYNTFRIFHKELDAQVVVFAFCGCP